MHKNYIQKWFDQMTNVKAFWLVTVYQNGRQFQFNLEMAIGFFTRNLKFLIKIACLYLQGTKSTFSNDLIILEKLWLTKLYNFITVTWWLFLKTPILKYNFQSLINKIILKLYLLCQPPIKDIREKLYFCRAVLKKS